MALENDIFRIDLCAMRRGGIDGKYASTVFTSPLAFVNYKC